MEAFLARVTPRLSQVRNQFSVEESEVVITSFDDLPDSVFYFRTPVCSRTHVWPACKAALFLRAYRLKYRPYHWPMEPAGSSDGSATDPDLPCPSGLPTDHKPEGNHIRLSGEKSLERQSQYSCIFGFLRAIGRFRNQSSEYHNHCPKTM